MEYRPLGKTGAKVSEVGFGAWAIGGNAHGNSYGPTDDGQAVAAVRRGVELGVTFFDTADVYGWGHSEELLGKALKETRDRVVIATKVGGDFYHGGVRLNFSPDYLAFALERSLRRLQTDHVDLWQLHNPPLQVLYDPAVLQVLELLRSKGKVLHLGVSVHEPGEAIAAMAQEQFEVLQLPFNLFRTEWLEEVFPMAADRGVGIIAREPLANGLLTGKYDENSSFVAGDIRAQWPRPMVGTYVRAARNLSFLAQGGRSLTQAALRFVLAQREVSATIPGAKSPAQAEENARASEVPPLTAAEMRRIEELRKRNFGLEG